jgi:hypothetical protein
MGSASARRDESSGAVWGRRDARICANRAPITRRSRGFASVTRARWRGVRRQRWLRDARRRLDERRAEDARPVPSVAGQAAGRGQAPTRRGSGGRVSRERRIRGLSGAWDDEGRSPVQRPAEALSATGHASGEEQPDRPGLAQRQDGARLGAGLQRAGGDDRPAARDRRRGHDRLAVPWGTSDRWSPRPMRAD